MMARNCLRGKYQDHTKGNGYSKTIGVSVEGELGQDRGHRRRYRVDERRPLYRPEEARLFVEKTGVDSLAIAIGTATWAV
jgi:fructose/tagatose bisphosphate aldolase